MNIERLNCTKGKIINVLQQNYEFYLDNIYFSILNDVDELMDTIGTEMIFNCSLCFATNQ